MSTPNPQPPFPQSATLYVACRSPDGAVQHNAYQTLWSYLYPLVLHLVRHQPDADELAQDCAQQALIRIHERLLECHAPDAFRTWARRIATNLTIDELRRRRRFTPLSEVEYQPIATSNWGAREPAPAESVLALVGQQELRDLLSRAPISDRSRRAVIGRFLDDLSDEMLAQAEGELAATPVLPSHIQVTRAKNLAKLREWQPLRLFLQQSP